MKYLVLLMSFYAYAGLDQLKSDYYCTHANNEQLCQLMNGRLADHAIDPLWLYNTAQCHYEKKNYKQAHLYFTQAAHYDGNNSKNIALKALYQAGNSAVQQKELKQALEHFEHVLSYEPSHQEAKSMVEQIKKALEAQEQASNNQDKKDDSQDSNNKQDQPDNKQQSNQSNDANNDKQADGPEESDKHDKQENNTQPNNDQSNKQEAPAKDEQQGQSYNQQDAQRLQEQLAQEQDASLSNEVSGQQLHMLKQVERAEQQAQKALLQQTTHTKRKNHGPQW